MLWHWNGPDPMRKLFAIGSKAGLSADTPFTTATLGEPNAPTQLSSAAATMLVPTRFLPRTPLFHVLAPHPDQTWPGMMVMPPRKSSVNGPLALRFRSTVNSSRTLTSAMLASDVAGNAPVELRSIE